MAVAPTHGHDADPDDARVDRTRLAARLLAAVPANEAFGIEVESAAGGSAEAAMNVAPWMTTGTGSLHSSGLVALAEASSLAAVIAAVGEEGQFDDILPMRMMSRLEFLAPARGGLRGRCSLGGRNLAALHALLGRRTRRARIISTVKVLDQDEKVVCRGSLTWSLRCVGPSA